MVTGKEVAGGLHGGRSEALHRAMSGAALDPGFIVNLPYELATTVMAAFSLEVCSSTLDLPLLCFSSSFVCLPSFTHLGFLLVAGLDFSTTWRKYCSVLNLISGSFKQAGLGPLHVLLIYFMAWDLFLLGDVLFSILYAGKNPAFTIDLVSHLLNPLSTSNPEARLVVLGRAGSAISVVVQISPVGDPRLRQRKWLVGACGPSSTLAPTGWPGDSWPPEHGDQHHLWLRWLVLPPMSEAVCPLRHSPRRWRPWPVLVLVGGDVPWWTRGLSLVLSWQLVLNSPTRVDVLPHVSLMDQVVFLFLCMVTNVISAVDFEVASGPFW